MRILIAEDEKIQREILRFDLERLGYKVIESNNGKEAFEKLSNNLDISILITDLSMPVMDGYKLIQSIRKQKSKYIFVIVLTSLDDKESLIKALNAGADDYLTKPILLEELKLRIKAGERLLNLESRESLMFAMVKLSEFRSNETGFHLERVQAYTFQLARDIAKNNPEFKLDLLLADEISKVSVFHDIGKVGISDSILHKPGKLSEEEFEIMKNHTIIGGELLKDLYQKIGSNYIWLGYEVAMFHHEKYNGRGYPTGASDEKIPIVARIVALADVYDAITTRRCYKEAISHKEAKDIIVSERGEHFDPKVVDAFLRQEHKFIEIKENFKDRL